jgi:arylsulfatase A-like enzyme
MKQDTLQNVVVVVTDALRMDRVGAYGNSDLTPNIDRVARDGTIFTNAYTTTNATDPAITSLHTGRYPLSHGVINHGGHVTDAEKAAVVDVTHLPQVLRSNGFETIKIGRPLGRWHRRGFDEYPEISSAHWKVKTLEKNISRMLYRIDPSIGEFVSTVCGFIAGQSTDSTIDGSNIPAERLADSIVGNRPFYGIVHLMDNHTPYSSPPDLVKKFLSRYEDENEPPETVADRYPDGSVTQNSVKPGGVVYKGSEAWDGEDHGVGTALINARYDAAVRHADRKIGLLIESLRDRDVFEETLFVVLSDHGESLTEHGICGKYRR